MPNPLQRLHDLGQSFWYDNIRRDLLRNGELARMVREDGLRGLTSNPTIFAKALHSSADYDTAIQHAWKKPPAEIFLALMVEDIQGACDVLRPVFDESGGRDGFCSIEVFPELAHDGEATLKQAHMLWDRVARPNVMVKIPATPECIPAIAAALEAGININITLMFGFSSYRAVVEAYQSALEKRLARGLPVTQLASVASLFVSRVDTKLDPRLGAHPELQGKAGIANARRMYQYFQQSFSGARWEKLVKAGAHPQRLLWASTSTKNPKYPDTLYADALIGPHTVDTMPDQTVAAFRDHGHVADTLSEAMQQYAREVEPVLQGLAAAGIDMEQVADELLHEGVASFQKSYVDLIAGLRRKLVRLSQTLAGPDKVLQPSRQALAELDRKQAGSKVWQPAKEAAALWSADANVQAKVANRLGWLRVADTLSEAADSILAFAAECRQAGFTDAVLLGMGGSSLAPEVFARIFGDIAGGGDSAGRGGGLRLHVLDTTNPDTIARIEAAVKLEHTLFLVSSKSGGTIEPNSLFAYFWSKLADGSHYAAITDPGTSLTKLAAEHKFRRVFTNPPDIGGRYSALSYFGIVPAALVGVDIKRVLAGAKEMADACGPDVALAENPAAELGAAIGAWAQAGRNKLTFVASPEVESLGAWLEQLIAESTGKLGKGIVPVAGEPLGKPDVYGDDRIFVQLGLGGVNNATSAALTGLAQSSPVIRIALRDRYDLGREFFRWEFATAIAGVTLGINPFDEPNVQESKDNTVRVLQQYLQGGAAAAGFDAPPAATVGELKLYPGAAAAAPAPTTLSAWLASIRAGDYIAVMAYLDRNDAAADNPVTAALDRLRQGLRDRFRVATTLGYGPRFLHSTGQLHKGGANNGVFLQLTAPARASLPIPGQKYGFATLLQAQAQGDFESLAQHQRRLLRVDLGADPAAGLQQLEALLRQTQPLAATTKGTHGYA